ncbi:MAG: hypothetical protein ACTS4V_01470 [Candidatus Hodgkinia cicadicola]
MWEGRERGVYDREGEGTVIESTFLLLRRGSSSNLSNERRQKGC